MFENLFKNICNLKKLCYDRKVFINYKIYKIIEMLAKQGKGIILISSYLPEVMGLSDRMVIMSEGKISGVLDKDEISMTTEEDILRMASSIA